MGYLWDLKKVWNDAIISLKLKLKIFQSTCISTLLYGSETWVFTKEIIRLLNIFGTTCYRIILRVNKRQRITNEVILRRVGKENLAKHAQERQKKFIIKCLDLPDDNITKKYLIF